MDHRKFPKSRLLAERYGSASKPLSLCDWPIDVNGIEISPETLDRRSDKPAVAKKTVGWAKRNQILLLPTQISPSPHMLFRPFRPHFGLRGL